MKKICMFVLTLLPLCASAQSLIVTLKSGEKVNYPIADIERLSFDESNVPGGEPVSLDVFTDPVLRAAVEAADADGNVELSPSEIASITALDLKGSDVESLAGIEYLTSLRELNLQSCMKLTVADLSAGPESLEMLQVGFSSNLTSLVLGEKPQLKELYAMYTGLTDIDLSGTPALEVATVQSTNIKNVKANDLKSLHRFTAGSDVLESVDLSGCDNLTYLSLSSVPNLDGFDISKFPALESFTLTGSRVKEFTTENNPELKELTLDNSEDLTYVNVSKSLKLDMLSCYSCWYLETVIMTEGQVISKLYGVSDYMITRVEREYPDDIAAELTDETFRKLMIEAADTDGDGKISAEEARALTVFKAPGLGLKSVDFFYFNNLEEINLSNNELETIDLSPVTKLTKLYLDGNRLSELDITRQKALEYLSVRENNLTAIEGFTSSEFKEIDLSHNRLTSVKLTYQSYLTKVDVSYNEISDAQILGNSALTDMDVSHNKISQMTLWSLSALVNVKFNDNPFTQLNEAHNWVVLETIDCSNTEIPTLNLSQTPVLKQCVATDCPNLATIYVGDNKDAEIVKGDNTGVVYGSPE